MTQSSFEQGKIAGDEYVYDKGQIMIGTVVVDVPWGMTEEQVAVWLEWNGVSVVKSHSSHNGKSRGTVTPSGTSTFPEMMAFFKRNRRPPKSFWIESDVPVPSSMTKSKPWSGRS